MAKKNNCRNCGNKTRSQKIECCGLCVLSAMVQATKDPEAPSLRKKMFVGDRHYLQIYRPHQQAFIEFQAITELGMNNIYSVLPINSVIAHMEKAAWLPAGNHESVEIELSNADYHLFIKQITSTIDGVRQGRGSASGIENALAYDLGL